MEVIEAFIEAARAPNFRIAAERCALSPAAFSRRIQQFQAYTGRTLFERKQTGMRLTEAGQECLESLEPTYQAMRRAALQLDGETRLRTVAISLSHSLAVGWMIPRLNLFRALHPHISVTIKTQRTAEAIRSGDADIGVCACDIDASGLQEAHFLDIDVTPVASPEVAARIAGGHARLEDFELFGITQQEDLWSWWSQEAGRAGVLKEAVRFDIVHAMYEAAAAGFGVAAGMSPTMGPHLATGRLIDLGLPRARSPNGYRLIAQPGRLRDPAVAAMWRWMLDAAAAPADGPWAPCPRLDLAPDGLRAA